MDKDEEKKKMIFYDHLVYFFYFYFFMFNTKCADEVLTLTIDISILFANLSALIAWILVCGCLFNLKKKTHDDGANNQCAMIDGIFMTILQYFFVADCFFFYHSKKENLFQFKDNS